MTDHIQNLEISDAQVSTTVGIASDKTRLLYIDNLRIVLTALVILHHLAITYGAPGTWYYKEIAGMSDGSAILMTLFLAINQSFFMGFFFMVSSYFIPSSLSRKGTKLYIQDRLKRLSIPLLFYILVISPLLNHALALSRGFKGNFLMFIPEFVKRLPGIDVGPLWFVETLLFFSLAYTAYRLLFKPAATLVRTENHALNNLSIALFGIALGVATFVIRIWLPVGWEFMLLHLQFPHFAQYIAMFVVGILAYQRGWLSGLTDAQGKSWRWVAVAMIVLFPVVFVLGGALEGNTEVFAGGLTWQSLAYSLWEQLMCVAMIVTLMVWFRRRFNRQGAIGKGMSSAAYATYVFHAPIIVLLALALRGIRLDLALKFVLVTPVAIMLSFLIGYLAKRLPYVRNIL